MQATVHAFDPTLQTGSVIRDDGVLLPFDSAAFEGSGLRLVRVGQRLTVDVLNDQVVGLRIVGVSPPNGTY
ncbi:cold-shock protein [Intrasporangium calvum]|uniref:Cold-shock protein n=1 Tax=Intrasporangium calvum TaxID=53358 RepID=A0ABT5GG43_9MICO|nr:cold-shock protein [Intrasporangium calvum]MDC5697223.1 cold-shock protein [Intrasporangium calvum]